MPNLQFELQQLGIADRHIAAGERAVRALEVRMKLRGGEDWRDTDEEERLHRVMVDCLESFRVHRSLIAQLIEGMRNGTLPQSDVQVQEGGVGHAGRESNEQPPPG